MLLPSIISILLITIIIFLLSKRKIHTDQERIWNLVDSNFEEWPKRPSNLPKDKNADGVYIDRAEKINQTQTFHFQDPITLEDSIQIRNIGMENVNSIPLYTTVHSDEEHFLTTLQLSFHSESGHYFMDVLSLDKDFPLDNENEFSILFTNNQQWNFTFERTGNEDYAKSISLSEDQLHFIAQNKIDKWLICRKKDQYYAVGALNFEIRKYIYKPEIQYTIQILAKKILEATISISEKI